jgi:uncharacterized ParB-like nuclease family protein
LSAQDFEQQVALSAIQFEGTTQVRAEINNEVVGEYAAAMTAGDEFPAVVLFVEANRYWIADGQHRLAAMKRNGQVNVYAHVFKGDRREAIKFALGANQKHGLRRSNADKRRAVEIALREFADLSSVEIGRLCGVSHTFVDKVRAEKQVVPVTIPTEGDKVQADPQPATVAGSINARVGADGKTRQLPRKTNRKSTVFDFEKWCTGVDDTVATFLDGVPKNRRGECVRFLQDSVSKYLPKPKGGTSRAARFAEAQGMISDAKGQVEELHGELENWLEGMPENLKGGQKAEAIESAIGELETMIASLEEAEGTDVEFPGMYS